MMRKKYEKRYEKKNKKEEEEKKIMRKELGLKRRDREVEGGNIKKKSEHVM